MKKLCSLLLIICSIAVFSETAYPGDKKVIREFSDVLTIKPDKFYEKCVILRPRQKFDYKFETSSPVYFDIHYHGEHGREHLIQKESISSLEKTVNEFTYKRAYKGLSKKATLCMLWRNNTDEPVTLTLDCATSKR